MKRVNNQKQKAKSINVFRIVLMVLFGLLMTETGTFAMLTIKANHDHIKIDFFYHGSTVSVRGEADQGTDLVIKIASSEGSQLLRKKGRVAGLLWMNIGNLSYEHVPSLYFLHSTKNLAEILSSDERDKYSLGYPALNRHIEIRPVESEEEKSKWFNEFVKVKESSKVYDTSSGKIAISERKGRQNYYILLDWPYQALQGNYTATVYAVKDKKVVETAESNVLVEQVGFVKTMFNMAMNNGALYGIISILVAISAGFAVGLIFRQGGGAH